jgi:hypothetical protein
MSGHERSHKQHTHTDREVALYGAISGGWVHVGACTSAGPMMLPVARDFFLRRSSPSSPLRLALDAVAALPASGAPTSILRFAWCDDERLVVIRVALRVHTECVQRVCGEISDL